MGKRSSLQKIVRANNLVLIIVTVIIILAFYSLNRHFLGIHNLRAIMFTVSTTGIIACGIGILLISGNVDLAAGAEGAFVGIFAAILMRADVPWPLALVLALLMGIFCGAVNAFFVNVLNFMSFIATIALSFVWSGLAFIIAGGLNIPIGQGGFHQLAFLNIGPFPLPFIIMVALFLLYGFILTRTRFGREIYMCGGNRAAARLAGINMKRITTVLFLNCGLLAGLAGCLVAAQSRLAAPGAVVGTEMSAIAAAILGGISFMGGKGSLFGVFIGLILINSFNVGLISAGFPTYWQITAQGAILLAALLADALTEKARLKSLVRKPSAGKE